MRGAVCLPSSDLWRLLAIGAILRVRFLCLRGGFVSASIICSLLPILTSNVLFVWMMFHYR